MAKYRTAFAKGKKGVCPKCGKRTLTLYVDLKTGQKFPEKYGKCERINNCGYWQMPEKKNDEFFVAPPQIPKPTSYIDADIACATLGHFENNILFKWFLTFADSERVKQVFNSYNVGTAKNDGVIFWQTDFLGKFRTGKLMYYKPNGKRNKEKGGFGTWIHAKMKLKDFNLKQTLFGINLLTDTPEGETIYICESEKTALMLCVTQGVIALATGGASNFGLIEKNKNILKNYNVGLIPDIGMIYKYQASKGRWLKGWSEKMEELNMPNLFMYEWWKELGIDLDNPENMGNDLGDYLILKNKNEKGIY